MQVTGCELNYHGSISLDPEICEQAGFYPLEFVYIWNKNSGHRISTYVLHGERGSHCCILNGAAARTCQVGDEVIISATEYVQSPREIEKITPQVLTFGPGNTVTEHLQYRATIDEEGKFVFSIETVDGQEAAVDSQIQLEQRLAPPHHNQKPKAQ